MPAIPLGTSTYSRRQRPPLYLKNRYFEQDPTNLTDQVALHPRPRLKAFAQAGTGPILGLYREGGVLADAGYSGAIICLSGTSLYRVTQTGVEGVGTATLIGTVDGDLRMTAEGSSSVVVLTCGTTAYHTNGATLTAIAFPDSLPVSSVDTLNSYFLFSSEFGRFYWSAIGGTTVSALDYATAESQPDGLIALKVVGDELWLFGRLSIEVWQPTGDTDLPFQRIGGRIFGIGLTARETVQKFNVEGLDTVCWMGTDRRVYRSDPNPVKISDHGIEQILQRIEVSTAGGNINPYATQHSWDGHDFYVLHIPGESSYAYDLNTKKWSEWTSYEQTLFRASVSAVGPNSQPLIGDTVTNQIWEMTDDERTDGGDPVLFEHSGLLKVTGAPVRCNNVAHDVAVGRVSDPMEDPMISMDWSDDDGMTFDDPVEVSLGGQGEYETRVMWTRLGLLHRPGRLFRWQTTEPVTVTGADYNAPYR